jgi:hypothetical protein
MNDKPTDSDSSVMAVANDHLLASLILEVAMFRTTDGKDFNSRSSAEYHQKKIAIAEDANARLKRGESIAEILRANGKTVPDEILERVTKDSKLVIDHWQCRDTPGYQPQFFEPGLSIYVAGDAGSWSGSYGNTMSLLDLARYANHRGSILLANTQIHHP